MCDFTGTQIGEKTTIQLGEMACRCGRVTNFGGQPVEATYQGHLSAAEAAVLGFGITDGSTWVDYLIVTAPMLTCACNIVIEKVIFRCDDAMGLAVMVESLDMDSVPLTPYAI